MTNSVNWSKIFSDREAKEYLGAQKGSVDAKNVALDMRLPGYFSYTEVLEIELSKALAGSPPHSRRSIASPASGTS